VAYCTITDVQTLNPKRTYNVSSTPTQPQVETIIDQVAAEIDTVLLGRGISVPVTSPTQFVAFLKGLNAHGAAAMAEMGMYPEASGMGATPHGQRLWNIYNKMLDRLRTGDLPTAAQTGDPRSFFEQYPDESPPKFGKDKVF